MSFESTAFWITGRVGIDGADRQRKTRGRPAAGLHQRHWQELYNADLLDVNNQHYYLASLRSFYAAVTSSVRPQFDRVIRPLYIRYVRPVPGYCTAA